MVICGPTGMTVVITLRCQDDSLIYEKGELGCFLRWKVLVAEFSCPVTEMTEGNPAFSVCHATGEALCRERFDCELDDVFEAAKGNDDVV